jgi:MFS family permease
MQRLVPLSVRRLARNIERARWDYPHAIWTMTGGTFINTFGGSMVFPIFTLYFTGKFGLTLTEAGLLSTLFFVGGFIGQPVGGFLTDRIGRKGIMVFALVAEATFSMGMAIAPNVPFLIVDIILFGLTVPMFNPASAAMVADLVPPERRAASYGLLRVAANAGVALGPTVAAAMLAVQRQPDGTLPPNAYLPLFVGDAATSLIFAWIIARRVKESKPEAEPAPHNASVPGSAARFASGSGYGLIFRDTTFVIIVVFYGLVHVVYSQMTTTFGVYMRDTYSIPPEHYGLMLASNAAMVVLFQFQLARWVDQHERSAMLALGAALYGVGFGLIGFVGTSLMFEAAVIILTVGEMVIVPASQTLVADLAPIDMRGRYQAVYGVAAGIGYGVGPVVGGYLFDAGAGQWIWIGSLIVGLAVAAGYRANGPRLKQRQMKDARFA